MIIFYLKLINFAYILLFSPATMEHVLHFEKTWNEFVLTVKDICRKEPPVCN